MMSIVQHFPLRQQHSKHSRRMHFIDMCSSSCPPGNLLLINWNYSYYNTKSCKAEHGSTGCKGPYHLRLFLAKGVQMDLKIQRQPTVLVGILRDEKSVRNIGVSDISYPLEKYFLKIARK